MFKMSKLLFLIVFIAFLDSCSFSHKHQINKAPVLHPELGSANIKHIYVFGDSISDTGNLFSYISDLSRVLNIRMEAPPAAPNGLKFSNNFLLCEYLAAHYKINLDLPWVYAEIDEQTNTTSYSKDDFFQLMTSVSGSNSSELSSNVQNIFNESRTKVKNKKLKHLMQSFKSINYAVANSTIGIYEGEINEFFAKFNLENQVTFHVDNISNSRLASPNSLHILLIGGNDIVKVITSEVISDKKNKIISIAQEYVDQISRLVDAGAKKLIVSTAPLIGDTPKFYNSSFSQKADELSLLFSEEVRKKIENNFSHSNVKFISIIDIMNEIIKQWPEEKRHLNCVNDFTDGYFNLFHFIANDGELETEFANECNQQLLSSGAFYYFDKFHGTDAAYKLFVPYYINAINELFSSE